MKKKIDMKSLTNGSYSMVLTAVIIAGIVLVNLIVGALPSDMTTFDTSYNKLFTIGDTTREVLASLSEDVTLNFITKIGSEDERIEKLLESCDAASSHVKVKKVDLVADPTFAKEYTDANVPSGSVIVTSGGKSKVIDYNSIYITDYTNYKSSFDGEGQITSAIAYVASEDSGKVYYTVGHDEIALSAEMTDTLEKANITASELNLLSSQIPGDCEALIIFAPGSDFTTDEAGKVKKYLENGGHALIVTLATSTEMPNIAGILRSYGVSAVDGYVMEGDPDYYTEIPYLLLPVASTASQVTASVKGNNLLYGFAQGIETVESDDLNVVATPLFTTSAKAFSKSLMSQTMEKESGDPEGPFTLAVQIEGNRSVGSFGEADIDLEGDDKEEKTEGSGLTKILYYTSPCLFSSDALSSLLQMYAEMPAGNMKLFADSVTYLTDKEMTVSIEAKSMDEPTLTVSEGKETLIGNALMFGLPAAVLIAGIAVTVRRRRR